MTYVLLALMMITSTLAQLPKPGGGGDDFSEQRLLDERITLAVNNRIQYCGVSEQAPSKSILEVYRLIQSIHITDRLGTMMTGESYGPMCEEIIQSKKIRCLLDNSKEDLRLFTLGNSVQYLQVVHKVSEEDSVVIHEQLKHLAEELIKE